MSDQINFREFLSNLSNLEIKISAGLLMLGNCRSDYRYVGFIIYSQELKERGLTWKSAKITAKRFKEKTGYPGKGWERKMKTTK